MILWSSITIIALIVVESHAAVADLFSKNAILLNEISGDSLLTLVQPAGDGNEEKRKRSDPLAPAAYHAQSRACNDPNEFFWILQTVD